MRTRLLTFAAALLFALPSGAQFYTAGSDPASVRWSTVSTANYSLIYPRGLDSLARVFAVELELAREPVGGSIGVQPNALYRKKMPVVLHTQTSESNGIVTWAPHRMELFTVPDAYSPLAMPSARELAIHESRHAAQMQLGAQKPFRVFGILTGETVQGALSAVYGGPVFLEGDAVATETALSASGRGRSAEFLEYVRACASEGQSRNYWQWLYGSLRRYTPDHYRLGYMMQAGIRTYMDAPQFPAEFYGGILGHGGWRFGAMRKAAAPHSGKTSLQGTFAAISDSLYSVWRAEEESRAPYTPARRLSPEHGFYTSYRGPAVAGGSVFCVRTALDASPSLVRLAEDGVEHRVGAFESQVSKLRYSPATGRIFWSERRPDPRWEMRGTSLIRYMEAPGEYRDLTAAGRLYNPAPHDTLLSVTEYPERGGSAVVILDARSGERLRTIPVPGHLQAVETAWAGRRLLVSAVSDEGFGIYDAGDGFRPVLAPLHVQIRQPEGREDGSLTFACDIGGTMEIYSFNGGVLRRLTSSRVGASDYAFCGDSLLFSSPGADSRSLMKAALSDLQAAEVPWAQSYRYPMAEELSAAEPVQLSPGEVEVSEPQPYSKLGHLMRFHSWLPIWFDYDSASGISFETLLTAAAPGVTAFFQNTLGTAWGSAGVSLTDASFAFRPAAHLSFTYAGLLPVVEARLGVNTRESCAYQLISCVRDGKDALKIGSAQSGNPLVSGSVSAYVPLYFNSGGVRRGVIPQLTWSFSSDRFHTATVKAPETEEGQEQEDPEIGVGPSAAMHKLTAGVRLYSMLPRASSAIYPRLGAGLNLGYTSRPGLRDFYGDKIYEQFYCYLPGFTSTQGIRLQVLAQQEMGSSLLAETFCSTLPRGFTSTSARNLCIVYPSQTRLSFDYGIPFASLEWAGLSPAAYLRNLELIPHLDCTMLSGSSKRKDKTLVSAGASLTAVLGNLLWIPYDTRIGVDWSVNAGSGFDALDGAEGRHYVGFVFSVDL